jgi:ribosomal protein L7Ae-like RNA K-turn-binding protein
VSAPDNNRRAAEASVAPPARSGRGASDSDAARTALGLLGLGARARRLAIGVDAAREALRRGLAEALVLPKDASERARERLEPLAGHRAVTVLIGPDADALGKALGHPPVHGVAVLDRQLARGLKAYLAVADRAGRDPAGGASEVSVALRRASGAVEDRGERVRK